MYIFAQKPLKSLIIEERNPIEYSYLRQKLEILSIIGYHRGKNLILEHG